MSIDLQNGSQVRSSWFEIYSAAVAVNRMCVAQGKDGRAVIECMLPYTLVPKIPVLRRLLELIMVIGIFSPR